MGKKKLAIIDDSIKEETKVSKAANETKAVVKDAEKDVIPSASEESVNPLASAEAISETDSSPSTQNDKKAGAATKEKKTKKSKASAKKGKAKYRSIKYKEAAEKVEKSKRYSLNDAIENAKQSSYSKFEGSLELHLGTNSKNIRGLVSLPFVSGKKLRILAFGKGAEDSGADLIGDDAKLNEIIRGITNSFDVIVTTAEWMPKLARAAKILGPRGLMPSPKNGTITENLKKAVEEIQSGKVEYKTEKNGQVIHLTVGKTTQPSEEIAQNTRILFNTIGKTKIKKAVISPSMGVGVKVDLASI